MHQAACFVLRRGTNPLFATIPSIGDGRFLESIGLLDTTIAIMHPYAKRNDHEFNI